MSLPVAQDAVVIFDSFTAQFPTCISPQFGFTDFLGEYGASGRPGLNADYEASVKTDLELDYNPTIGAVCARKFFVPHNQIIAGYSGGSECSAGLPSITWTAIRNDTPAVGPFQVYTPPMGYCRLLCSEPGPGDPGYIVTRAYCSGNTGLDTPSRHLRYSANMPSNCQGFTALLYKYIGLNGAAGGGTNPNPVTPGFHTLRFRCTTGSLTRWYSISFIDDGGLYFAYTDGDPDSGPYQAIGNIKSSGVSEFAQGGNGSTSTSPYDQFALGLFNATEQIDPYISRLQPSNLQPGTIPVVVVLMAGQLSINIGGDDLPILFPQANLDSLSVPFYKIDQVEYVAGVYCWLEWSVHPMKFTVQPGGQSQMDMGFVPTPDQLSNLSLTVHYANGGGAVYDDTSTGFAPSGSHAEATLVDATSTILYYDIVIYNTVTGVYEGVEYADITCCVKAVTGRMPPVVYQDIPSPYVPFPVEEIDITHAFDLSILSIRSSARIGLDNAYGKWSNLSGTGWCDTNGTKAITINLGYASDPHTYNGYSSPWRQFSGMGNVAFGVNQADGGDSHAYIECIDMWRPLDTPSFAFPWFDNMNVYYVISWLASKGGCPQVRQQFWLDGYVPTNPYAPCPNGAPSYYLPSGPAGTANTRFASGEKIKDIMLKISNAIGFLLFFDVYSVLQFFKFQLPSTLPAGQTFRWYPTQGPGESLTEIWGADYRSSLDEVRNNITVIGAQYLSPAWNPLVFHATDSPSINDPTAFNYKGFSDPIVWADNIFAQADFGQAAANAILAYMRMPAKTASLTTWLQFDQPTYPLDIFYVTDLKSGFSLYPFLITKVMHKIRQDAAPTTTVEGRWFPAFSPGTGTSPP